MKKVAATMLCEYGANFITEGMRKFMMDDLVSSTGGFDQRTMFFATSIEYAGGQWYYNYLNYNAVLAAKGWSGEFGAKLNKRAYAYLQLGYVPVVFLPSFCSNLNAAMLHVLEQTGLPFIKTQPMAFGRNKLYGLNLIDAWVSKMDAAEYLGVSPEDVRSADLARRMLTSGNY